MTALLSPNRRGTNPLALDRVLVGALELAGETHRALAANPHDFDRGVRQLETAVARFRSAFLATPRREADAALAYHDRANEELNSDFSPLYYRRGVLENVLTRYERAASELVRALA
jgi:hypothetical protein